MARRNSYQKGSVRQVEYELRIPLNVITSSGIMITDSGDCDHPPERSED